MPPKKPSSQAVIDLFITDPAAPATRPTDDVDCVVELSRRVAYHALEEELRSLGFNLVRREMDLLARELDLPPRRISFVASLRLIRNMFYWAAITGTPGALPKRIGKMRVDMRRLILPPRKSDRHYPRHVKIKMSGYMRNHGHPGPTENALI